MTTDEEAGSGVENDIFERFIYKMQSSYQDRLGTNIGKALKNRPMRFLADEGKSPIPYEIAEEDSFWTKSRQKKKDLAEREAEKSGQVRQVGFFLLSSSVAEMKTGNRLPTQARDKYVRTDSVEKQRAFSSSFLHRYLSVLPVACRHQRTIRLAGRRMRRTGRVRETPLFGAFLY